MRTRVMGLYCAIATSTLAATAIAGCPNGRDPVSHECYTAQLAPIPLPPSLEVVASVDDAEIVEDGKVLEKGRTVLRKAGAHTLVVRAKGFEEQVAHVVVKRAGERLKVVLVPLPAVAFALSSTCGQPSEWKLTVDGKEVSAKDWVRYEPSAPVESLPPSPGGAKESPISAGASVLRLPLGPHTVRVTAVRHAPWQETIEVIHATDKTVLACLTPEPATLTIDNGAPGPERMRRPLRGVRVEVDGKVLSEGNPPVIVAPGVSHTIVVTTGAWTFSSTWTPEIGQNLILPVAYPAVVRKRFTPSEDISDIESHCGNRSLAWTLGNPRACRALGYWNYQNYNYEKALQFYERGCNFGDPSDDTDVARSCLAEASILRKLAETQPPVPKTRHKHWEEVASELCDKFGHPVDHSFLAPETVKVDGIPTRQYVTATALKRDASFNEIAAMACLYPQSANWTGLLDTTVAKDELSSASNSTYWFFGGSVAVGASPTQVQATPLSFELLYAPAELDGWLSFGGGFHETVRYVERRISKTESKPLFMPFGLGVNATLLLLYPHLPIFLRGQAEATLVANQTGTTGLSATLGYAFAPFALVEGGITYDSTPTDSRDLQIGSDSATAYLNTFRLSYLLRWSAQFPLK